MKMKIFQFLLILVCIGFVLMLAGSTAHAATHEKKVELAAELDPRKDAFPDELYPPGTPVTVTFKLRLNDAEATEFDALGNRIQLILRATGDVTAEAVETTPAVVVIPLSASPVSVNIGAKGAIVVNVMTGEASGGVQATFSQQTSLADFPAAKPRDPQPILVVLPPQETLHEDGLLSDLPDGFDKTWLENPTKPGEAWVADYCAAGERDILQEPQRIRLADGRRYHKDNLPADAAAYQASVGNLFTAVVEIRDVKDLSAWHMDVAFNPQVLQALRVREGKFLAKELDPADPAADPPKYVYNRINPFFTPGLIDNDVGVITGIAQARVGRSANQTPPPPDMLTSPSPPGVGTKSNSAGILFCIDFRVLEYAEESLGLHNVQLSNSKRERISYWTAINPVVVTHKFPAEDVTRDKRVDILDLMMVAGAMQPPDGDGGRNLGRANPINPRADVNDDGIINALDLIAVSSHADWAKFVEPTPTRGVNAFVGPTAPALVGDLAALTPSTIQGWIDIAQVEDDGSAIFDLGIANLERLLQATVPERTKLLLNYPNPFNPETWIPYQLAKATDVSVSIYSVNGALVRTLALGHQAPGVYQSKSQAAYWDGRNELGERVASGVYFYTLTAGDFSATGKMLVRK